jgi:hypothetical protein
MSRAAGALFESSFPSRFYESARLEITARAAYASAKSSGLNIGSEILSNKEMSMWLLQGANRILAALPLLDLAQQLFCEGARSLFQ